MTGCGPTCLAMAVAGLTGNADANPARIADFAEANGYYAAGTGTMWSLFTEAQQPLGSWAANCRLMRTSFARL